MIDQGGGGGGGGGGLGGVGGWFRPIILENSILRYELKEKARIRPNFFRMVLGSCAQFCACEASEQKWGQKPKNE